MTWMKKLTAVSAALLILCTSVVTTCDDQPVPSVTTAEQMSSTVMPLTGRPLYASSNPAPMIGGSPTVGDGVVEQMMAGDMCEHGQPVSLPLETPLSAAPTTIDTDRDGVDDDGEPSLGTDPAVPNASFDVTKHCQVDSSLTVTVDATVTGEQVSTLCLEPSSHAALFPETMPGFIGQAVDLSVDGSFDAATLTFSYDVMQGVAQPTVYYFSEATQTLTMVDSIADGNTVTATVTESATYILLDSTVYEGSRVWEDVWGVGDVYGTTEIVLVIDDSGSLSETDPDNRRVDLVTELIGGLPSDSRVGIVTFSTIINTLTPHLTDPQTAMSYCTPDRFRSSGGTKMYTAVETALALFEGSTDATQRMMVVLTDGLSVDLHQYDTIVQTMLDRHVALHMIDLDSADAWFEPSPEQFAAAVGGTYYRAEDMTTLCAVFETIGKFVDITTDSDGDTIPDYYEDHVIAFNGVTIPLDKTKADTDEDGIPDGEEVSVTLEYSEDGTKVHVKGVLLSDPTLVDSDGDGVDDSQDDAPLDNTFMGTLTTQYASGNVEFSMDYGWFSEDNTVYQPSLSQMSILLSSMAYHETELYICDASQTRQFTAQSADQMLTYFGMEHAQSYELSADYHDIHLSEVIVGYRTIVQDGKTKSVLAVVVRGTNATIEEWSSNCDIGNLLEDTEDDDWVNTDNHKGFDVAATRIMRFVEQYIDDHGLYRDSLIYWVTGHSRGAGIANIIGANLEKAGKTAFTYTFAAPNSTLAADTASYMTIFNVINEDDFVPRLPIEQWGYSCYGRSTKTVSIKDSYEAAWENFTGIWDYNPSGSVDSSVETLAGIITSGADPRIDAYRYTCACHGDGSNDTITIRNNGMSESSREKAIAKIPQNALSCCTITRYDGGLVSGWDFEVCQTPAYFMQLLAAFMGGEINEYRFAVELNIADRYESAKSALISVGVGGVEHPHYTESYYILAMYLTADDFS